MTRQVFLMSSLKQTCGFRLVCPTWHALQRGYVIYYITRFFMIITTCSFTEYIGAFSFLNVMMTIHGDLLRWRAHP